jgi:endonuclease/exonuclease/phosphatase family metal-dependent hydrolase
MTYNVGNGLADPARLATVLRQTAADVVGLQELAASQAERLALDLVDLYPHQVLLPTGFSGKGLLSRYPIVDQEQLRFYPDRPDLRAVVDVAGLSLSVVVAHPPPPRITRSRISFEPAAVSQLDALSEVAVDHPPGVLLGDLNMTPRHPVYAQFVAAGLVDAFAVAGTGRGWTLPRRLGHASRFKHRLHGLPLRPVARVDYIWYTQGIGAEAAWLGADAGSDHLPVLARLTFPPAERLTAPDPSAARQ